MDKNVKILSILYIRKQIKSISFHLPGIAIHKDIECVHRARVAMRRLENALKIFRSCFRSTKVGLWRKELRRFRNRLDRVRDLDIQITFLRGFLETMDDNASRPGLARMILRLEQRRTKLHPKIVRSVSQFESSKVMEKMRGRLRQLESAVRKRELDRNSIKLHQKAQHHIAECLIGLLSYEDSLDHPEAARQHHRMRIAAKRLRYQMEVFSPVYDESFQAILTTVKKVQTCLGNIHDYDVWLELLTDFEAKEYQRTVRYFGDDGPFGEIRTGIRTFYGFCRQERERLFTEFVNYWKHITAEGFPAMLRKVLHDHTDRCRMKDAVPEKTTDSDLSPLP